MCQVISDESSPFSETASGFPELEASSSAPDTRALLRADDAVSDDTPRATILRLDLLSEVADEEGGGSTLELGCTDLPSKAVCEIERCFEAEPTESATMAEILHRIAKLFERVGCELLSASYPMWHR